MTTTAAIYPEVAAILEAPERIRKEAAELIDRGELHKIESTNAIVFESYRYNSGGQQRIRIALKDRGSRFLNAREQMAELRSEIFDQLVDLLETEERSSESR